MTEVIQLIQVELPEKSGGEDSLNQNDVCFIERKSRLR